MALRCILEWWRHDGGVFGIHLLSFSSSWQGSLVFVRFERESGL